MAQQYIILCLIPLPSQFIDKKKNFFEGENSKDQDLNGKKHKLVANVCSVRMRINRKYLTRGVTAILITPHTKRYTKVVYILGLLHFVKGIQISF